MVRDLRSSLAIPVVGLLLMIVLITGCGHRESSGAPVVLFPAFHLTKLDVTVKNQHTDPACPASGRFQDWYQNDQPGGAFSQVCKDELLTLRYDPNPGTPMPARFSEQPGVTVQVIDYGRTSSAPFYRPLYQFLGSAGYTIDKDIRVAGYDARLTPDMGDFLERTKSLIEQTYRDNGNRPVALIGHSNGPIYAHYLLTHTTPAWRHTYIHSFTSLAGNFPGQGLLFPVLFAGLNVQDMSNPTTPANAISSARMYQSEPSTYLSAADPAIFTDREVVVTDSSTGRQYHAKDYPDLLTDAGLSAKREIAQYYIGLLKMSQPSSAPGVDVYAEKGSGLPTVVGARLPNLATGQVLRPDEYLYQSGDSNQEDITNNAVQIWASMPCHHFSLTDNPGVGHFDLPGNPNVLHRFRDNLAAPPRNCS
jgi:lysophospholipase-3